jgi:hypothetical protein
MVRIPAGTKVYEFSINRSKSGEFQFINGLLSKKVSKLEQSDNIAIASESQPEENIQAATQQQPQEPQNETEIGWEKGQWALIIG